MTDDGAVTLQIAGLEVSQRLVREDDAETECIIRPVALENGDARLRPCLLHQAGKIQPGRAAADDVEFSCACSFAGSAPPSLAGRAC